MKCCSKCKRSLPLSEFNLVHPALQNGKLRPDCKECVRQRTRRHYKEHPEIYISRIRKSTAGARKRAKEYVFKYLSQHPCVDCGEDDPIVLDFDHVRGVKKSDVSRLSNAGARQWRLEEEISKCEVRCANCHRRVTLKRMKRSKRV